MLCNDKIKMFVLQYNWIQGNSCNTMKSHYFPLDRSIRSAINRWTP